MKRLLGIFLMLASLLLAVFHFGMYGFNLLPESQNEFIADVFDLCVFFVGLIMYKKND